MTLRERLHRLALAQYEVNYTCRSCRREVFDGSFFCESCYAALPLNRGAICPVCGRRVKEAGICLECKRLVPVYARARSALCYEDQVKALMREFKTGGRYLAALFAREMLPLLKREFGDADFLIPVPMSKEARRRRGYAQAELLAELLSLHSGIAVLSDAVVKVRDTPPQKSLSRRQREDNLKGCFHVRKRAVCRDKVCVIVDDVLTTGATADALAKVLLGAGARRVYLLTACSVSGEFE